MASKTYRDEVLVLRKTKLKESDLILTLLARDGRQIRAVAKGARKPTSSFASRLELFASANVLFAVGRNLDIVKEARSLRPRAILRNDISRSACASPMAELLDRTTQADLPVPRLFDMAETAFDHLERAEGPVAPLVTAAFLFKCISILGFKPSMGQCVECGCAIDCASGDLVAFSPRLGGVLCPECAHGCDATMIDGAIARWVDVLIGARFDEVMNFTVDGETVEAVLRVAQRWIHEYVGNLKSLGMLVSGKLTEF